ncbi:MAG: flagellar assembly protein FliW [Gemmatimonadetes bacterium]|nr:MAG: flagellar assembly protein FliW [Gemmatimonadota bacterium]
MTQAAALKLDKAETPETFESELLGVVPLRPEQIITFPEGIVGFPDARRYALLPASREGFYWLQSLDHEPLAFVLIDPFVFVPGYSVELGSNELGPLDTDDPGDLAVLAILALPREPGDLPTVNLQGPVAVNLKRRLGRQVILAESPYGTRWPLELKRRRKAS